MGKSSVTVNLALALAAQGRTVGVLDADIYGHSVPAMLGVADARPTAVEDMIMPVPAHGLKVISIGMLKPRRDQVVAWRGPILDRALTQMLADVYWGDLDYLLLDLPPGTGDVAISLGQKLPNAEVVVVTTPQAAAAEADPGQDRGQPDQSPCASPYSRCRAPTSTSTSNGAPEANGTTRPPARRSATTRPVSGVCGMGPA